MKNADYIDPPQTLTLGSLARMTGLPRGLLQSEIDGGHLPAVIASSGRRLVYPKDFRAWAAAHRSGASIPFPWDETPTPVA